MSKARGNTTRLPLNVATEIKTKLEEMADEYGTTTNGYLTPYLRAIAKGEIVLKAHGKGKD